MKHYFTFVFSLLLSLNLLSQDVIINRKGDELKSKILEVTLKTIRYKKFDNPDGPIFEILKSDVFMIKYENGTKDIFNTDDQQKENPISNLFNAGDKEKNKGPLAFTANHRSTSFAYGLGYLFGSFNISGLASSQTFGPLFASFDRALSDKFSLGIRPACTYILINDKTGFNSSTQLVLAGLQLRTDFHFATTEKLDPYVGVSAGYSYFFGGSTIRTTLPLYGVGIGFKYYGKSNDALLVEFGLDSYSFLKVGYTFSRHK